MEMIEYEEPTSWGSKGMDWNTPDPRVADYAVAIRNALMERCAAAHIPLPWGVATISPWKPVTVAQLEAVVSGIASVASRYFNRDFDDYEDDWSDFPRMWTYRDLVQEEGCRLWEFAKAGDLCENGGAWMKWIKNAIDRLTVVTCPKAWGTKRIRSGSMHDPPFAESIGKAMSDAMDPDVGSSESEFSSVPMSVYAWSGNTHWRCPDPNADPDAENNVDGYCGYAKSVSYTFRRVRSWVAGRELDFLAYALVTEPKGAVPYSQELTTSTFDAGESRFEKGLNMEETHVEDPSDMEVDFGNVDSIPQNETVPTSDFDENGTAVYRRSAKRGYEGRCWFFLDYGCQNGFRFRKEQ